MSLAAAEATEARARTVLKAMFDAAVASADPAKVLAAHLPEPPKGRCVVVGAGKAAAAMAVAVEAAWPHVDLTGIVVAPRGHALPTERIEVLEAAHPVPDADSEKAGRRIFAAVQGLGPDDLVLALISGGGSSLMILPREGLQLADKQKVFRLLLRSGLDIRVMNAVRRRLSAIKGGRLAVAAAPARVVTLGISDIPGDDAAAIASGPTIVDDGPDIDFAEVVKTLGTEAPEAAVRLLLAPPEVVTLPRPADFRMIATPAMALDAAAEVARQAGLRPIILGDAIEGEASEVGGAMAALARGLEGGVVLLSGGETTVTIGAGPAGRGGRNTEFLLALGHALDGAPGIWSLAADTDGQDGAEDAAGAILSPDSLLRASALGLNPRKHLDLHDSGTFFSALGDLLVTGPTHTNVNDFRAILVASPEGNSNA